MTVTEIKVSELTIEVAGGSTITTSNYVTTMTGVDPDDANSPVQLTFVSATKRYAVGAVLVMTPHA